MIARVFPRKTEVTPDDAYSFVGPPPLILPPNIEEVHISAAFSWDLPEAERIAKSWERLGVPVKVGGPATGMRGEGFAPGVYLKTGNVISSRGCPNKCWFCNVWKRDGQKIRELPIVDGWILRDDNILACSQEHIEKVFQMLGRQKNPVVLNGGLEAARLNDWHVNQLSILKPARMFFAYDTPDDLEPLIEASKKLVEAGLHTSDRLRCYVLCGFPKDTIEKAEERMRTVVQLNMLPYPMPWRRKDGTWNKAWSRWKTFWAYPRYIQSKKRKEQRKSTGEEVPQKVIDLIKRGKSLGKKGEFYNTSNRKNSFGLR